MGLFRGEWGAAQTDLANLKAEDIDWGDCVIAFRRAKTGTPSLVRFGKHVADVLKKLPEQGFLFPSLQALSKNAVRIISANAASP